MALQPGRYAHCFEDGGYSVLHNEADPYCDRCMCNDDDPYCVEIVTVTGCDKVVDECGSEFHHPWHNIHIVPDGETDG